MLGRAWELTAADWDRVMNINFMATVHLARAFVPRLLEAGRPAQLLVTGSMASVTARPGISPYVAAKHALLGLCESLNHELAAVSADVGVTLLLPGKVATGMSREDYPDAISPDEAARIAFDAVMHRRPLAFTHADRIPEVEQRFAAIIAGGRPASDRTAGHCHGSDLVRLSAASDRRICPLAATMKTHGHYRA